MEEKSLLKFTTAIPFPLLVYKVNVRYNEVRKASGVAYILLDVIEKTAGSEDKICDVLLKFGIPRDLHYIFGKEISNLIGTEILSYDYDPSHFMNPKYFSEIRVKDVSLTAKGRKMFREGAIPTGEEKVKTKDIFYSPVTRKFDVSYSLPYTSLDSSVLYEDIERFLGKTIDVSGLKDYIEANPTKVGLKAEERVVEVEIPEVGEEKQVRKEDGTQVIINKSGAVFLFETSDETAYFNKWYSSAFMTKCLLAKEKYKFVDALKNAVDVPTVLLSELTDIVGAYIPNDVSKQAKRPCKIFIDGGRLATDRTDNALRTDKDFSIKILGEIGGNAEFALLDTSALHYYSAVNVKMPCNQLDDIIANLYEDNVTGKISDERFDLLAKKYEAEQAALKSEIVELKKALDVVNDEESNIREFLKVVNGYTEIEELTPEILNNFIDRIYIGEKYSDGSAHKQEIRIIYKFIGAESTQGYKVKGSRVAEIF